MSNWTKQHNCGNCKWRHHNPILESWGGYLCVLKYEDVGEDLYDTAAYVKLDHVCSMHDPDSLNISTERVIPLKPWELDMIQER